MRSLDSKDKQLPEVNGQPGLEVVAQEHLQAPQQWSNLQVVPKEYDSSTYPEHNDASFSPQQSPSEVDKRRRRRLWLIIGGVVLVLIIIAAVVGGVVGSRARRDGSNSTPSNPTPTNPTPTNSTVTLKSIRQGSGLSVIGWRTQDGTIQLYLYYQDPDDNILFSAYDDGRGLTTEDNSYWLDPASFPTDVQPDARPETRIAGAMIVYKNGYAPQAEFFYTNSDNRLLGTSYNAVATSRYVDDSVGNMNLSTGDNSSIAAYWPYIIFQDSEGKLQEVMNFAIDNFDLAPQANWSTRELGVTGLDATRLAIVPLSTNYSNIVSTGGYGVFYQRNDAQLSVFIPDSDSLPANYTSSWPASSFPNIVIPKGNSIAAFATARPNDSQGRVNIYLLYQDSDNRINMVWADNNDTWNISKPVALASADQGTDIACLTMPTSYRDIREEELPLEQASVETTRCYFQRKGRVQEVALNGTDWVELGIIPMS